MSLAERLEAARGGTMTNGAAQAAHEVLPSPSPRPGQQAQHRLMLWLASSNAQEGSL
ncbi:hypothetical protein AHiyo6_07880 [Arthrobacter sp. Hiyo6]|nr:hypothetical protein AHiyo6_07880 [Arthrobacter sp. Hiyo6]